MANKYLESSQISQPTSPTLNNKMSSPKPYKIICCIESLHSKPTKKIFEKISALTKTLKSYNLTVLNLTLLNPASAMPYFDALNQDHNIDICKKADEEASAIPAYVRKEYPEMEFRFEQIEGEDDDCAALFLDYLQELAEKSVSETAEPSAGEWPVADLIVIGSKEKSLFEKFALGSFSSSCLSSKISKDIPIMIVK